MRRYIKILIVVAYFILEYSCEYEADFNISPSEPKPVVNALLTNELKVQEIFINSSTSELNAKPIGLRNFKVSVTEGVHLYVFKEDSILEGKYISEIPFRAAAGVTYELRINYENFYDTAYAEMVSITPMPPLVILPYDSLYRVSYTKDTYPSYTEFIYNWESIFGYCSFYKSCTATEFFYTIHTIEVNEIFAPKKQIIAFPEGTVIIRKKYSLSTEHQRFIRSLLMETEWRGGLFDVEQGNVKTNFRNGTKGWFATCMYLSDTNVVH